MTLNEIITFEAVNQRVLGSSPRGGAFYRNPIYLFRLDFLFLVSIHWVCGSSTISGYLDIYANN